MAWQGRPAPRMAMAPAYPARLHAEAREPSVQRRPETDRRFERAPSVADQVVPEVALRFSARRLMSSSLAARLQDGLRAISSSPASNSARRCSMAAAIEIAGREIHVRESCSPVGKRSSTRLIRSNSSDQSTSEMRRMLVMMLRTVTFAAPCLWCSSRTTSSAVVSCAASRSSSQSVPARSSGSWSRSRCRAAPQTRSATARLHVRRGRAQRAPASRPPTPSKRSAMMIGLLACGATVDDPRRRSAEDSRRARSAA